MQTQQSEFKLNFEFNVRPNQLNINYIDQGRGIIAAKELLLCQKATMIEGFSSQSYLSEISESLASDEFALITGEAASKYRDT